MRVLRFASQVPVGGCFHARRADFVRDCGLHGHDYAEVTLLERGTCRLECNGTTRALAPGDVVLVRPSDAHAFRGRDFTLFNVAFAAGVWARLRRDHFAGGGFPCDTGPTPPVRRFGATGLARLRRWAGDLLAMRQSRLLLDAFLLDLLDRWQHEGEEPVALGPPWLRAALAAMTDERLLAEGLPALRRLSGVGGEHLNRSCRRWCGRTATAVVEGLRLESAADLLRHGDRAVGDIAHACGFAHVGWFVRRFKAAHGQTPGAWRRAQRQRVR